MLTLDVNVLGETYVLQFAADTPDDRCDMSCDEDSVLALVEVVAHGYSDGRGIPMSQGSFTQFGVAAALTEYGYEVSEVETLPPDIDGEDE